MNKDNNKSHKPSQQPAPTERKIIAPGTHAKDSASIPAYEMAPKPVQPKPKPEN